MNISQRDVWLIELGVTEESFSDTFHEISASLCITIRATLDDGSEDKEVEEFCSLSTALHFRRLEEVSDPERLADRLLRHLGGVHRDSLGQREDISRSSHHLQQILKNDQAQIMEREK